MIRNKVVILVGLVFTMLSCSFFNISAIEDKEELNCTKVFDANIESIEVNNGQYIMTVNYVNLNNCELILAKNYIELTLMTDTSFIYSFNNVILKRAFPTVEYKNKRQKKLFWRNCDLGLNSDDFLMVQDSLRLEYNLSELGYDLSKFNLNEVKGKIFVHDDLKKFCYKIWTGTMSLNSIKNK